MTVTVPPHTPPTRIDLFLVRQFPQHSRNWWQKHIDAGHVHINCVTISKHAAIEPGDIIEIDTDTLAQEPQRDAVEALPDINILGETDDFLVIAKPPGLLVHPTEYTQHKMTLRDWILQRYPEIAHVGDDTGTRPGIVHRLDKEVSGVMVIAKTPSFFSHLKAQFVAREVRKEYRALVHGALPGNHDFIRFSIDHAKIRGMMRALPAGNTEGKEALTEYEVLTRFSHTTYCAVFPHTGRTHQIRVHMHAIMHPIVGDPLYHAHKVTKLDKETGRIFLHAYRITFKDIRGTETIFESPLPLELTRVLEFL